MKTLFSLLLVVGVAAGQSPSVLLFGRGADNAFAPIPDLWIWLDATSAVVPGNDKTNGAPTSWMIDKSGNNVSNLCEGRFSYQVVGDGTLTNTFLAVTNSSRVTGGAGGLDIISNGYTAMIVFRYNGEGGGAGNAVIGSTAAVSPPPIRVSSPGSDGVSEFLKSQSGLGPSKGLITGQFLLLTHMQSNNVNYIRTNGVPYAALTVGAAYDTQWRVFDHVFVGTSWMYGDFCRLLLWKRVLTTAELATAEAQCKLDFGL